MKRVSQVIKIKDELAMQYLELHANPWKSVGGMISECNIQNYSIYRYNDLLFAYFEYVGDDYEGDMVKMGEHEETKVWWDLVKPCQQPVDDRKEGEWWHDIEEIFHQD